MRRRLVDLAIIAGVILLILAGELEARRRC
jgi:hypothetical protein